MQADFLDAHERHWDDAERLLQAQRWANADHLYGMAAECGLKRLMLAFGMTVNMTTGSPTNQGDWVHANNVWVRFVPDHCEADDAQRTAIEGAYRVLTERLAPHAYPVETGILYETSREEALHGAQAFCLDGFQNAWVVDRLANESAWESIAEVASGVPRIVFFSIKGGWDVQRHCRPAPGHWQEQASASWSWIWTSDRQGCPAPCCRLIASRNMASPTGWWRIWSITGTCS